MVKIIIKDLLPLVPTSYYTLSDSLCRNSQHLQRFAADLLSIMYIHCFRKLLIVFCPNLS